MIKINNLIIWIQVILLTAKLAVHSSVINAIVMFYFIFVNFTILTIIFLVILLLVFLFLGVFPFQKELVELIKCFLVACLFLLLHHLVLFIHEMVGDSIVVHLFCEKLLLKNFLLLLQSPKINLFFIIHFYLVYFVKYHWIFFCLQLLPYFIVYWKSVNLHYFLNSFPTYRTGHN